MVYAKSLKLENSWLFQELESGEDECDWTLAEQRWCGMTPEKGYITAGILFKLHIKFYSKRIWRLLKSF